MRGGVRFFNGGCAAALAYLECGRSRADDYYLVEGDGLARRVSVDGDGRLTEHAVLDSETYLAWVSGHDPDSGEARGRLRNDEHALRFAEVVVNGPKSWSLAAEMHPDIDAAYAAAQQRAAEQTVAWLGQHMTVRVGPRGAQVAVPVEKLEAAIVMHHTSRAGDPHRHLHVQINARMYAHGKWRGLDSVAMRDSVQAINGIGHAAVMCDPEFRAALAAHGYSLDIDGDIEQLTEFVGPFSKRASQIAANIDRYEKQWRTEHPDQEPGPALWRAWDRRAWADDRPDKGAIEPAVTARERWLRELDGLGYRTRHVRYRSRCRCPGRWIGTRPPPRWSTGSARWRRRGTPPMSAARSNSSSRATR